MNDSQNPTVVDVKAAKREAYEMGFNEFETFSGESDPEGLHYFKEGARWANHILPRLRSLAGYTDSGHGTFTNVETVETENGETVESHYLLDEIVQAWDNGARDAIEGMEKDADRWD